MCLVRGEGLFFNAFVNPVQSKIVKISSGVVFVLGRPRLLVVPDLESVVSSVCLIRIAFKRLKFLPEWFVALALRSAGGRVVEGGNNY